jgi:hypothetical protein
VADGFLGRWSQRKLDARSGKPVQPEPELPAHRAEPEPLAATTDPAPAPLAQDAQAVAAPVAPEPAPLTLEDTYSLTPASDFRPFIARGVAPEVQNAAMKKLFSDPHFNVMDKLDVYVDDYSQPDPIPMATLRQLASARFLGLFDQEEKEEAEAAARSRDVADDPRAETVAESAPEPAVPHPPQDADPDLRLQPDDAAPGEDPGRGAP